MDNAQKAIMIGVGLFITIIIIAAVMLITGMGQDLLNSGTQQLSGMSSQLQQQLTDSYDNVTMTGAQVLSAVKNYYNNTNLAVYVDLKANGGDYWATPTSYSNNPTSTPGSDGRVALASTSSVTKAAKTTTSMGDITTAGKAKYIPTTAQFSANLITLNDAIVGIRFQQK